MDPFKAYMKGSGAWASHCSIEMQCWAVITWSYWDCSQDNAHCVQMQDTKDKAILNDIPHAAWMWCSLFWVGGSTSYMYKPVPKGYTGT